MCVYLCACELFGSFRLIIICNLIYVVKDEVKVLNPISSLLNCYKYSWCHAKSLNIRREQEQHQDQVEVRAQRVWYRIAFFLIHSGWPFSAHWGNSNLATEAPPHQILGI